jgi:hypothetical protein
MGVSDEDDDWKSVSGDYDGHPEGRDDEVIILETSTSGDSVESILLFPDRNEDNSDWLCHEGIKTGSVFNKMKPDIATVRKRKRYLCKKCKNDSVMDK